MSLSASRRGFIASAAATATVLNTRAMAAPQAGVGWREVLVVVPDLAPWVEVLTTVGGWEVAWRGPADSTLNGLWRLPDDARVEQCLMRNVGTTTGYLRLAKVTGATQHRIRPNDQAWETGGIQALDIRVLDMDATLKALEDRGWRAPADPVRYTAYNVLEVIQWAPSSPDGVRLSFIQRISPPLRGWPEIKRWSRVSNAASTVANVAAMAGFMTGALGLKAGGQTHVVGGDGPNVMGLPYALARTLPIDIRGFAGAEVGEGAIELISMPGAGGRDFAEAAHPPNLGIAGLRFLVRDIAAAVERAGPLADRPAHPMILPPYGQVLATGFAGPGGFWIEFVQRL